MSFIPPSASFTLVFLLFACFIGFGAFVSCSVTGGSFNWGAMSLLVSLTTLMMSRIYDPFISAVKKEERQQLTPEIKDEWEKIKLSLIRLEIADSDVQKLDNQISSFISLIEDGKSFPAYRSAANWLSESRRDQLSKQAVNFATSKTVLTTQEKAQLIYDITLRLYWLKSCLTGKDVQEICTLEMLSAKPLYLSLHREALRYLKDVHIPKSCRNRNSVEAMQHFLSHLLANL